MIKQIEMDGVKTMTGKPYSAGLVGKTGGSSLAAMPAVHRFCLPPAPPDPSRAPPVPVPLPAAVEQKLQLKAEKAAERERKRAQREQ